MSTGQSVPESLILASAITALYTFIGNYLLLFPRKSIQPFLTEILRILIESVFVTISTSRAGLVTALMILMFWWADWKTNLFDVVNFHAPLQSRRARIKKVPWINSKLKKGMRDRDAPKRSLWHRMIHATGQSTTYNK